MFVEAIEDILRGQCEPSHIRAIEAGGSHAELWAAIESAGFLELLATEEQGGAGLSWPELFPVLVVCGRYAVPLPIGQTMAARALLGPAGVPCPAGTLTMASGARRDADGSLHAARVPFGSFAGHVLLNDGKSLLLLDAGQAARAPTGVHGSLLASLSWSADKVAGATVARIDGAGESLLAYSAAVHAALMAGAAARVFDMTLQYANDRVQFGKSIGKFQAVQHQLSVMAELVASMRVSAEMAFAQGHAAPRLSAVAVAKGRSSEAAAGVAATGHALHGAIGVTAEYDLQLFTRRLHEWRMTDGSEAYWQGLVGRMLMDAPPATTVCDFVRELTD